MAKKNLLATTRQKLKEKKALPPRGHNTPSPNETPNLGSKDKSTSTDIPNPALELTFDGSDDSTGPPLTDSSKMKASFAEQRDTENSPEPSSPDEAYDMFACGGILDQTDMERLTTSSPLLGTMKRSGISRTPFPSCSDSLSKSEMRSAVRGYSMENALELEAAVTREEHEMDAQDEALLRSTTDLFRNKLSARNGGMNLLLAIGAFLDFVSFLAPSLLRHPEDGGQCEDNAAKYLYRNFFDRAAESVSDQGLPHTILAWFESHSDALGIIFSLLWFVHSFDSAGRVRHAVLRDRDRRRLLSKENDGADVTDGSDGKGPLEAKEEITKSKDGDKGESNSSAAIIDWVGGAWGIYAIMIGIQLLLLPVGFYTMSFQATRAFLYGAGGVIETPAHHTKVLTKVMLQEKNIAVDDVVSTKFQQSLLYVVFHQLACLISHHLKSKTKEEIRHQLSWLKKYLAKFAIRHPLVFKRKLKKFLLIFRWVRFAAPLIGGLNKIKGNVMDLLKKRKQQRESKILRRILKRQRSLSHMSESERQDRAPVVIQKVWRARQQRRAYRALKIMRCDNEMLAALKLQRQLMACLERARTRLARKKIELAILQDMERRMVDGEEGAHHVSAVQRKRMYELQDELKMAAKKRRQTKMLLRPNTRFAVMWKFLFVSCLLVEISQKAMKPKLKQYHKAQKVKRAEEMDWFLYIQAKVVPSAANEWNECAISKSNPSPPWYCDESFVAIHTSIIKMIEFFVYQGLAAISVICFLDVFVTFFTGEIDPITGELVPKPFFKRWILPGVAIQLLLNPRMVEVSAMVKALVRYCFTDVGPVTMWRWMAALFIPAVTHLMALFERKVWRRLVREQNAMVEYIMPQR